MDYRESRLDLDNETQRHEWKTRDCDDGKRSLKKEDNREISPIPDYGQKQRTTEDYLNENRNGTETNTCRSNELLLDISMVPASDTLISKMNNQEESHLGDGVKDNQVTTLLLLKELPSWATRQTAQVPPNSHKLAECQGCIMENGTPHSCDMKEDSSCRVGGPAPSGYPTPSSRYPMMQQLPPPPPQPATVNPYAPCSEEFDPGSSSHRRPSMPMRRREPAPLPPGTHSYYGRHVYDRNYYDCENESYDHYPVDVRGIQYPQEVPPRVSLPQSSYGQQQPSIHGYNVGLPDPNYVRSRHARDHLPVHYHQQTMGMYPPYAMTPEQVPGANAWYNRTNQDYYQYEQPHGYPDDLFRSQLNPVGDTHLHESQHSAAALQKIGSNTAVSSATENESDKKNDQRVNSPEILRPSSATESKQELSAYCETDTNIKLHEISEESKRSLKEKDTSYPVADLKAVETSSIVGNNRNSSQNDQPNADVKQVSISDDNEVTGKKDSTISNAPVVVEKQDASYSYSRKSPCAFTIDFSSLNSSSEPIKFRRLPRNSAQTTIKPESKATNQPEVIRGSTSWKNKDTLTSGQKTQQSTNSKFLKSKGCYDDATEDIDHDEDEDAYMEPKLVGHQRTKSFPRRTKVEMASVPANNNDYMSARTALRTFSPLTNFRSFEKTKSKMHNVTVSKVNRTTDEAQYLSMSKGQGLKKYELKNTPTKKWVPTTEPSIQRLNAYISSCRGKKLIADGDESPGEISEAETYTIQTAEPDRTTQAERDKIDLIFNIGMSHDYVENGDDEFQRNSSRESSTSEENEPKDEDSISRSDQSSLNDEENEVTAANEPVAATLQNEPRNDFKGRQQIADKETVKDVDNAPLSVQSKRVVSSSGKRLLPVVPADNYDSADGEGSAISETPNVTGLTEDPTGEKSSHTQHCCSSRPADHDLDRGFFEVSSDAPQTRLKKKITKEEMTRDFGDHSNEPETDRKFEILTDVPLFRQKLSYVAFTPETSDDRQVERISRPNSNRITKQNNYLQGGGHQVQHSEEKKTPLAGNDISESKKYESLNDRKPPIPFRGDKPCSLPRGDEVSQIDRLVGRIDESRRKPTNESGGKGNLMNSVDGQVRHGANGDRFVPIGSERTNKQVEGSLPFKKTLNDSRKETPFDQRVRMLPRTKGPQKDMELSLSVTNDGEHRHLSHHVTSGPFPGPNYVRNRRTLDGRYDTRPPMSGRRDHSLASRSVSSSYSGTPQPTLPTAKPAPQLRQRSLSRPPMSRDDPVRQSSKLPKHVSLDNSDASSSSIRSHEASRRSLRERRPPGGESSKQDAYGGGAGLDNEAKMKRSKSASTGLRNQNSETENPKLHAYLERMKYDPQKAIKAAKSQARLSASSRSDDTDGSSYDETFHTPITRRRFGNASFRDQRTKAASSRSGTRPGSTRPILSSEDGLKCKTTSETRALSKTKSDATKDETTVKPVTMRSIQNLSEEIKQMTSQLFKKIRSRSPTKEAEVSECAEMVPDDPQLKILLNTLEGVKQILELKLHS